MKTVIIEEHEVVHQGVRRFLANASFDVIGHCRTPLEYPQVILGRADIELVLTEASIDGMGLRQVIATVKEQSKNAKVIVFSEFEDELLVQQAEQFGADGYISKSVTASEFADKMEELKHYGNIWPSVVA